MPASMLSETKRLQSRFLPFLTSRGIVTRSVSQLPKPQIPRLRRAPLGMTKQKAKSEKRNAAFLRFPQRPRNRHSCGAQRRQQSADKSHYDCENDAHQQRCRRDLERKRQFAEAVGLSRSRGIAVHGEGGKASEDAAENGQQHRFQHKRKQNAEAREAQSAQRANLARALRNNGVHGVHGAK